MQHEIPFPDHFGTGIIQLDVCADLRPGDMVRLTDGNSEEIESYEVLSIREDNSLIVDKGSSENPVHMTKEELAEELEQGVPHVWTILNRATVTVDDSVNDTLVLFSYAFTHDELPEGECSLAFVWAITPQQPVTMMPETNGMVTGLRFDNLREALTTGEAVGEVQDINNGLTELYETFDSELLSTALDEFIIVSEFNATKLLDFKTDPTYDEETAQRLERDATSMEESIDAANSLYD